MTNELGSTLQDIEAKAERRREAMIALMRMYGYSDDIFDNAARDDVEIIRKYIEEN